MNQRRKCQRQQYKWFGIDAVCIFVDVTGQVFICLVVLEFFELLWGEFRSHNSVQELLHRHGDVASMLKIMERVGSIHGRNDRNKLAQLVDGLLWNGNVVVSAPARSDLGIVCGHVKGLLNFVQTDFPIGSMIDWSFGTWLGRTVNSGMKL